jgi:DNA-binding transcriptional regulator YiaG
MTIKKLRTASGMTQQQFSDYFNIPKRTIENWEGGQRKCPEYLLDLMEYKLSNEGITAKGVERTEISTREILELRSQGMNISEIAEAIGCTKYTVHNRLKMLKLK